MKTKPYYAMSAAVLTLLCGTLVGCTAVSGSPTEEIRGQVLAMQDLYTLEKGDYSGFYQRLRQVEIDDHIVYIPLTGASKVQAAQQLALQQHVQVQVDQNRMVRQLTIESEGDAR